MIDNNEVLDEELQITKQLLAALTYVCFDKRIEALFEGDTIILDGGNVSDLTQNNNEYISNDTTRETVSLNGAKTFVEDFAKNFLKSQWINLFQTLETQNKTKYNKLSSIFACKGD